MFAKMFQDQKKKRRDVPQKKWTNEEVEVILEYILQKGNLEKPTAQIFYKKLIEETKIEASWELVKYRVKNLRTSYNKANEWRKSTGAGVSDELGVNTVDEKIRKICPHYRHLSEIFGRRKENLNELVMETINLTDDIESSALPSFTPILSPALSVTSVAVTTPPATTVATLTPTTSSSQTATATASSSTVAPTTPKASTSQQARQFAEKLKRRAPKSHFQEVIDMESKREKFLEKRLELEKERIEKEKQKQKIEEDMLTKKLIIEEEMQAKKLKMEEDMQAKKLKMEEDLQVKKLQLEQVLRTMQIKIEEENMKNNFNLKLKELDQKERIAKYELDLKFKAAK